MNTPPASPHSSWLRCVKKTTKELTETVDGYDFLITVELVTDSIPASPAEAALITTEIEATLTIGSAIYIGVDRQQHWASQVGASTHTMVVGRQYRLVAQVLDCLYLSEIFCGNGHPRGYDCMNAPTIGLHAGAASTTIIGGGPYGWSPGSCTSTSQGQCDSGGPTFRFNGADPCDGNSPYAPGAVYPGEWLTFLGPAVAADISIGGTSISGFYGSKWVVGLKLESRAAP